jgi:predicted DsbA family dithiol-disulfide isomerase
VSLTVHVWSDVVCPWCFLGKRRLERAISEFGEEVEVIWHSFELDPLRRAERTPDKTAPERLAEKYGMPVERARLLMEQMRERGKADGIEFALERGNTLQSFDAHRLLQFALLAGKQAELKERFFVAHFTETLDLGVGDVLVRLAGEVDLDRSEVRRILDSDAFTQEVRGDEEAARQLGVTGVPFFVIGRYGVAGAQSTEVLLQTLDRAHLEIDEEGAPSPG